MRTALTGGIASGKSFVASQLEQRGTVIIDSDVLAREVVRPGSVGLAQIEARFGKEILSPDGTLDRPALGSIVFADDDARVDLNAIVHPLVRQRSDELAASARGDAVVLHVIPLLVETGLHHQFERIIVVDVPVETQVRRLVERDNLSIPEAHRRIAAQASREDRARVATWVIDNDGDKSATISQVDRLWRELT